MKYRIKYIGLFILTFTIFSCKAAIPKVDSLIFERIEYVHSLKSLIEKNIWSDFSNQKYDVPLIYYTDSFCYVANPTKKFTQLFDSKLVYESENLLVFETGLIDSIPFHMEVSVSLGDSCSDYNCKSPFMKCSSPELTNKFISDVNSTEIWATMIMHEYFHGFQFKHLQFLDFYEENINTSADTLQILCKNNAWFKESIRKENELLLSALKFDDYNKIQASIIKFFDLRNKRLKQTKELLDFDIKNIEQTYETMEGTARYIEYSLFEIFKTLQSNKDFEKRDSLFNSYKNFKDYTIEKDEWLWKVGMNYFYAIGFNIARILDKLKVNYKSRLFNERIFLDDILREQIRNK